MPLSSVGTVSGDVIHFPKPEEMEVGAGFAHLAGHDEASHYVAGAIDGCHIRIVPPAEPLSHSHTHTQNCYFDDFEMHYI